MRFMILVKASKRSETGAKPDAELLDAMGKFHDDLARAGVLLAADGLQPSSKGARIAISGGRRVVTDGPFAEPRELIAGYTLIQVRSREEAIEWAKRIPNPHPGEETVIELRPLYEIGDLRATTDEACAPFEASKPQRDAES